MIVTVNNNKFKIRKCKDEDYRFVYSLSKENMYTLLLKHWRGWNPKVFRGNFNKKNTKIIEYRSKRIGFYDLEIKDNFTYIHNIQVSKFIQGKGLGTCLMNLMEKETRKHKLRKIRLRVFKDNLARKLYLKIGYKQIRDEGSSVILDKKV